jgi:hypothetical protein
VSRITSIRFEFQKQVEISIAQWFLWPVKCQLDNAKALACICYTCKLHFSYPFFAEQDWLDHLWPPRAFTKLRPVPGQTNWHLHDLTPPQIRWRPYWLGRVSLHIYWNHFGRISNTLIYFWRCIHELPYNTKPSVCVCVTSISRAFDKPLVTLSNPSATTLSTFSLSYQSTITIYTHYAARFQLPVKDGRG